MCHRLWLQFPNFAVDGALDARQMPIWWKWTSNQSFSHVICESNKVILGFFSLLAEIQYCSQSEFVLLSFGFCISPVMQSLQQRIDWPASVLVKELHRLVRTVRTSMGLHGMSSIYPKGRKLSSHMAKKLAKNKNLILLKGKYFAIFLLFGTRRKAGIVVCGERLLPKNRLFFRGKTSKTFASHKRIIKYLDNLFAMNYLCDAFPWFWGCPWSRCLCC